MLKKWIGLLYKYVVLVIDCSVDTFNCKERVDRNALYFLDTALIKDYTDADRCGFVAAQVIHYLCKSVAGCDAVIHN